MTPTIRVMTLAAVALAATACTSAQSRLATEPVLNPTMGDATRANIDAMAIAPTAAERANTFIPFDRARRAKAISDYREGTTDDPEVMSTRGN